MKASRRRSRRPKLRLIRGNGKRGEQPKPAPSTLDESEDDAENSPRGIFEDRNNFPGVRRFVIVGSDGAKLRVIEERAERLESREDELALEKELRDWLNTVDPIPSKPRLRIV
jgi:hypothetical protein